MNKDAIMASIIGFAIGMFITGSIIAGPRITKSFGSFSWPTLPKFSIDLSFLNRSKSKEETTEETAQLTGTTQDDRMVTSPEPDQILYEETLTIEGNAPAGSMVVAQGVLDDIITSAETDGSFAVDIDLIEGRNDIVVASYDDGKPRTEELTVFYAGEEF